MTAQGSPAIDDRPERQRLMDLLADRATCGLSLTECVELDELACAAEDVDLDIFDRIAAEIAVATDHAQLAPPMPDRLRRSLLASLPRHVYATTTNTTSEPSSLPLRLIIPWVTAAAAIIVAAIALTETRPPASPSERDAWTDRSPDLQRLALAGDDQRIVGEIVWSTDQQRGILRITGLQPNDPKDLQYQLWIFDAARQDRGEAMHAVDGGVFDVDDDGTVTISITPAIRVFSPALFAVTSEPPGGVVRHDPDLDPSRYRILVTSTPPGAPAT